MGDVSLLVLEKEKKKSVQKFVKETNGRKDFKTRLLLTWGIYVG